MIDKPLRPSSKTWKDHDEILSAFFTKCDQDYFNPATGEIWEVRTLNGNVKLAEMAKKLLYPFRDESDVRALARHLLRIIDLLPLIWREAKSYNRMLLSDFETASTYSNTLNEYLSAFETEKNALIAMRDNQITTLKHEIELADLRAENRMLKRSAPKEVIGEAQQDEQDIQQEEQGPQERKIKARFTGSEKGK